MIRDLYGDFWHDEKSKKIFWKPIDRVEVTVTLGTVIGP
jgi:hypothetical protein